MSYQKLRSIMAFTVWCLFSVGCSYGTSQSRIVSTPNGVQMRESGQCVGFGCGGSAYAYGGGMWARGGFAPYPYSPSDARFGAIEAYRARNAWVRSNAPANGSATQASGSSGGEARDPRLDRLVPYVRHMANAMCNNNLLGDEDCAPPERARQRTPVAHPARQADSVSGNRAAAHHERRRRITADELE